MKEQIELRARNGGLVVALDPAQDPALYFMKIMAAVIFWGDRIFCRINDTRYEEAFAVHALTVIKFIGKTSGDPGVPVSHG